MSDALERKVREVCRAILGNDAVVYIDAEAALGAVVGRFESEMLVPGNAAEGDSEDNVRRLRDAVEEVDSDVQSLRWRVDELLDRVKGKERKSA